MENKVLMGHSYKMRGGSCTYRVVNIFDENVWIEDEYTKKRKYMSIKILNCWLDRGIWEEVLMK